MLGLLIGAEGIEGGPSALLLFATAVQWRTSRSSGTRSAPAMRAIASKLPGFFPFSISDR